jgi:DNA-directed RNA polymerase subunit F
MSNDSSTKHTYYANCRSSPDFAIIEDTWQYPKNYVRKRPHWTDELVDELVQEAWHDIPQEWINRLVDSMPQRLRDCIQSKGQLVEWRG